MTDPQKTNTAQTTPWFWVLLLTTAALGGFLRLHLITGQVLLDDEWHALHFSSDHSLWYVLTHFSRAGANTIPINAYVRMLLMSAGWSEMALILPALAAGIAALIVFPLALKRLFAPRIIILFAFLFAVSPLIILYSRVCRPYSIYMLLGFLAVLFLYKWTMTGKKIFGIGFTTLGVICVYFHFVGVIFIFVPLGCAIMVKLLSWGKLPDTLHEEVLPSIKMLAGAGCAILTALTVLLSAALIQRIPAPHLGPAQFTMHSVLGFMQILSGTSHVLLNLLFYTLLCIGLWPLFRKSFLLGFVFISLVGAYVVVFLLAKPNFAHVPLVLARYAIPSFPFAYLLVALGVDSLWKKAETIPVNPKIIHALCFGGALCFLTGLVWTGPLRQTYAAPNNFTSHSAFQGNYAPINWLTPRISEMSERPYAVSRNHLPEFYHTLTSRKDVQKIIEYPMQLSNHFNLFYYYQRFHKKNVAVGYTLAIKASPDVPTGGVVGNMIADQVLSQTENNKQLKFRNLVNVMDMAAVKKSNADLVILHKNPFFEMFEPETGNDGNEIPLVAAISAVYRKIFGQPVFENRHLVVFPIHDAETK